MTSQLPKLGVLYINPAGGCNLHCRHCWVNEGSFTGELLSIENWEELLSQSAAEGCSYLKFTGGEPLLYHDIVPLYRYSADLFPKVVIETNGTLEPDGLWEAFAEKKPFHVSVSLDNAEARLHDEFRGQTGAWEKTVEFAEKLVKNNISNQIIMSVSSVEREPVESMIELVRKIGVDTLKINFITPSGRGRTDNFFDKNPIEDIIEFFTWIDKETPPGVLPSVPAALLPVNRLKNHGYCPVRNLMGVLPDGTFSLCGVAFSRKEMAWGKFPDTTVHEAWENSPVYKMIRSSLPESIEGVCHRCLHRDSCIGQCVVNNMETGGSVTSPDILCQRAYEAGLFPKTRLLDR